MPLIRIRLLFIFLGFALAGVSQNPNDCENAIIICGDSSLGIDPIGIGFDEFSLPDNQEPPCYYFDQNTIWFKFIIIDSGTFTFDLIPDNGEDDYDFAIFGPTVTCTTLGNSIRCSSTNPQEAGVPVATGLNMDETDINEGPGQDGNGYLRFIDANEGDIYYLLVDRAIGSGPMSLFYTGTAKLPNSVEANQPKNLINCDTDGNPDGFTEFNLEVQTNTIIGLQTDVSVTYHTSLNDASIGINPLTSPHTNVSNPQTIYARILRPNGCNDTTTFTIETGNLQVTEPPDAVFCSYRASAIYYLEGIATEVVDDPRNYVFSFHYNELDATNNSNPIGKTINLTQTPLPIFIRVSEKSDPLCFAVTTFQAYINRIKVANTPQSFILCDEDPDEKVSINLFEKNSEILNGLSPSEFQLFYYTSPEDRTNGINPIPGNFQNTENPQTVYAKMVEIETGCFDHTQFNIIVNPIPIPKFDKDFYYFCLNATSPLPISVQAGFKNYVWNTGEKGTHLNTIYVDAPGTYSVTVTNDYGCENNVSVSVFPSNIATISEIKINDFTGGDNSIEIIVEGEGDYRYALDNNTYFQKSNVFTKLSTGYHTVFVIDRNGCGMVSEEILILDYLRFFTPNNDNVHDFWHITGIEEFPDTKIYIFDRYGKFLKQILPISKGWDGTNQKGAHVPSSDYWFTIKVKNRRQYRGHFTLKR